MYSEDSETQEIKKALSNNSHKRTNKQEHKSQTPSYIDWRAAIALEFFYNLIENHFEEISRLFQFNDNEKASENLLAFMIESVCEYAIVKTRSSSGIYGVVSISKECIVSIPEEEKETRGKHNLAVDEKDNPMSLSGIYRNDLETLEPTLTLLARSSTKVS